MFKAVFTAAEPTTRQAYIIALLAWAGAVAGSLALPTELRSSTPFLLLYPATALAAWKGGFGPGALVTLLAVAATVPRFQLGDELPRLATTLVFALTGLALSVIGEAMRRGRARDRQARVAAERQYHDAEQLQEMTTALSRAAKRAEVNEAAVLESTHSFGAAGGLIATVAADGRSAEIAHSVGFAGRSASGRQLSLDPDTIFGEALNRGTAVVLASRAARLARYRSRDDDAAFLEHEALAVVPVHVRGRTVALLVLADNAAREWTSHDGERLEQLARRVGDALERADMYESAERARADSEELRGRADQELADRQRAEEALRDSEARYRALAARTSRLHALTAALSEAVTVDAVARAVVRHGRIVVGAQSGSVTRVVDDGTRFVPVYADDESLPLPEAAGQFDADPGLYSTDVVRLRQPVFIGSFGEWQKRYWRSAAHAADGGYASAAALPLIADGVVHGVLAFHFTAPLNFDDDYRVLLRSVAQHCAQAMDRARLYEGEQRARADAESANRTKDEFLSTVSHELRTPLNAILGWATMLRGGSLDVEKRDRAMQAICDNAARQARLVDELLDVSRIIAGRVTLDRREVDLRNILRGAVEAMMPQAEAKGLDLRFGPQLPVLVVADERRLEQVFLNLLSNAVKFTPAGGRIEVTLAVADNTIEVRVADTGIGIDPAFLPHAFDRFRQADSHTTRTYGGLGLGLSIASHLVDAHGGRIQVHSDGKGTGTTCTVSLPLAGIGGRPGDRPGAGAARTDAQRPAMPDLHGLRVLVVDDEADAREMMAAALERCGSQVEAAGSASAALEILRARHVDVLLSDIGMPDEDGYELIRRVRSSTTSQVAHIPAAAVTAYAREDQRQRALSAGFQVHLAKPLDPYDLAEAVAALAASRTSTPNGLQV